MNPPNSAEGRRETAKNGAERSNVSLVVNGAKHQLELDNRTTLLDALREHLKLTGTKGLRPRAVRRLHGVGEWRTD